MSQLHHIFFDEARDNLDLMEQGLLRFDPRVDEQEQLNAIFRAAHSVKGGAAAFGFADVAEFSHLMESLLDRLRGRELEPDPPVVDLLLESVDAARGMLAWHRSGATGSASTPAALVARLRAVALGAAPPPGRRSLVMRIGPVDRIEDLNAVIALFRDIPGLGTINQLPDTGDGIRIFSVRTDSSDEELMALFAFHVAGELVSIRGAEESGNATPLVAPDAGGLEPGVRAVPADTLPVQSELSTIRVGSDKVNHLVDLADAIAITQAMLEHDARTLDPATHSRLLAGLAEMRRNTLDLRQSVLAIRMMPMAVVLNRFPRMLRDLARKLGKKFTLVAQGEDTELDMAMVEKIADPLMHLVRNSCDHGIETPAERIAAGKPESGTITLSVILQEEAVRIEVRDDGRGLARAKILKAARDRALEVSEQMVDAELWQVVFEPGFSTAVAVTDVSGRGVGLDVVKRNVEALGGVVEIDSMPGQGTCVSMRLPVGVR